jgi:hypothetical protein
MRYSGIDDGDAGGGSTAAIGDVIEKIAGGRRIGLTSCLVSRSKCLHEQGKSWVAGAVKIDYSCRWHQYGTWILAVSRIERATVLRIADGPM